MTRPFQDDQGVAAVVGFVLILAAAITYYSYVVREDMPKWGAANEHAWDGAVGDAMTRLERAAGAAVGSDTSVRQDIPPAPGAPGLNVPFLSIARGAKAGGSVGFEPRCGGVDASHVVAGVTVPDVVGGARGCIVFRAEPAYAQGFGYRTEFGGVLRVQGDKAFVLSGPPLQLAQANGKYVASLTLVDLDGRAGSHGADNAPTTIDLSPRPATVESALLNNSASAAWTLTTAYPAAWSAWFADEIGQAGFDPALNYACAADDARCPGLGANDVRVVLGGPDGSAATPDLSLSISYGRYEASIG
jgi:hypothetical protein